MREIITLLSDWSPGLFALALMGSLLIAGCFLATSDEREKTKRYHASLKAKKKEDGL